MIKEIFVVSPLLLAPMYAYSAQYLTVPEAQRVIFPEALRFEVVGITLSKAEIKNINKISDGDLEPELVRIWKVFGPTGELGIFMVYDVIGKHEYITFAVGFSVDRVIRSVEILEYRETHGDAVTTKAWRDQFKNKTMSEALKVGSTITNISGATLSSKHITAGIEVLRAVIHVKGLLLPKGSS